MSAEKEIKFERITLFTNKKSEKQLNQEEKKEKTTNCGPDDYCGPEDDCSPASCSPYDSSGGECGPDFGCGPNEDILNNPIRQKI